MSSGKPNIFAIRLTALRTILITSVYICVSAFEKSVSFNLDNITESMSIRSHRGYVTGVINVFKSLGLIELRQDVNSLVMITKVNERMIPLIKNRLSKGIVFSLKKRADNYSILR